LNGTNPAALNPLTSAFYFLGAQKSLISRPWGTAAGSFSFVISSLSLIVAIKDFSVTRYAFFPFIFLCWREGTLFCWASRGQIRGERSSTIKIRGTGTMKSYEENSYFLDLLSVIGFPPGGSVQCTSTQNTNTTQKTIKQNIQHNN
jgi:hypothetical protein